MAVGGGTVCRRSLRETALTDVLEDVVLGPPKTNFSSSRNTTRFTEGGDKGIEGDEADTAQKRWPPTNRKNVGMNETEGRSSNKESWTSARERRARENDEPGHEGKERNGRYNKREPGDEESGERPRRGFGFGKDPRWANNDDPKQQNNERRGGWREREKEKREVGWDRGTRVEKEPEWMDSPAAPSKEVDPADSGFMSHSHEEFQRWKERMKASQSASAEEKPVQQNPVPPTPVRDAAPPKPSTPLVLEGLNNQPFGGWGEGRRAEDAPPGLSTPKGTAGKGKASRFGGFFAQQAPKEEPQPEPQPQPETNVQKAASAMANGSSEDKEGFQRILQMLGGTNISKPAAPAAPAMPTMPSEPSSPPPKGATNGSRKQSRFFGAEQKSMSPQQPRSPMGPPFPFQNLDSMKKDGPPFPEDPGRMLDARFEPVMQDQQRRSTGPSGIDIFTPPPNGNEQRPPSSRFPEHLQSPPSRGAATPEMSIQDLLAQQNRRPPQADKNGDFLLSLLNSKQSKSQQPQRPPPEKFQLWRDQPPETHAPQPRAPPPPGFIDDHLLRNSSQMSREEQQQMLNNMLPQRGGSQRTATTNGPPPGFFDENFFIQQQQQNQQRRSTAYPDHTQQHQIPRSLQQQQQQQNPNNPRRMSSQPMPPGPQLPPSMHQPPFLPDNNAPPGGNPNTPFLSSPPPPGFNPHMRHPPGFANTPNIFQAPQAMNSHSGGSGSGNVSGGGGPSGISAFAPAAGGGGGMLSPPHQHQHHSQKGPAQGQGAAPPPPPGFFNGPAPPLSHPPGMGGPLPPPPPPGFLPMRSLQGQGQQGFDGGRR